MDTEKIVGGILFVLVTLAASLLALPRFRKYARWRDSGAPMSLRSRLLFPLFPLCCCLGVLTGARLWFAAALLAWLLGFSSFQADSRRS